ncbi:MAG: hypothetical protein CL609_23630 [Anaerolineaceae bacterium]|nr:hypothetical protein [Anaerolineaceae bacterium]
MIPEAVDIGALWKVLPEGIHDATINEIHERFATNKRRKELFACLKRALKDLKFAGCMTVYLDGSFITEKKNPGDYDCCWDVAGVDDKKIKPIFLDFKDERKNQKSEYRGEFFPSHFPADGQHNFLEFFQIDKDTGHKKGIIRINLI